MSAVAERPSVKKPKLEAPDGSTTNSAVNMQQHGFSGETVEIKLFKAEAGESSQQFVALNSYSAILHREKWVRVPVEVADHLESLQYTVQESDPMFPDDPSKNVWAQKARIPLQRRD